MGIYEYFFIYSNMKLEIVALFLELIVLEAFATGTNGNGYSSTQIPTTNRFQATDYNKSYVVNLTKDSFNKQVSNNSHFVMFYDPT